MDQGQQTRHVGRLARSPRGHALRGLALGAALLMFTGCDGTAQSPVIGDGEAASASAVPAPAPAPTNDGAAPPLAEVWPTALEQAEAAEEVNALIRGHTQGMVIEAEVAGQFDDSNYQVNATMDDLEISIIFADDQHYLRGNEAYWEVSGAPEPERLDGEWVEAPSSLDLRGFSLSSLWEGALGVAPAADADLETSAVEVTELNGRAAYHYTLAATGAEVWVSVVDSKLLKASMPDAGEEPTELEVFTWEDAPEIFPPDAITIDD